MPARARTTLLHLFQALMASWLLAAAVPAGAQEVQLRGELAVSARPAAMAPAAGRPETCLL